MSESGYESRSQYGAVDRVGFLQETNPQLVVDSILESFSGIKIKYIQDAGKIHRIQERADNDPNYTDEFIKELKTILSSALNTTQQLTRWQKENIRSRMNGVSKKLKDLFANKGYDAYISSKTWENIKKIHFAKVLWDIDLEKIIGDVVDYDLRRGSDGYLYYVNKNNQNEKLQKYDQRNKRGCVVQKSGWIKFGIDWNYEKDPVKESMLNKSIYIRGKAVYVKDHTESCGQLAVISNHWSLLKLIIEASLNKSYAANDMQPLGTTLQSIAEIAVERTSLTSSGDKQEKIKTGGVDEEWSR